MPFFNLLPLSVPLNRKNSFISLVHICHPSLLPLSFLKPREEDVHNCFKLRSSGLSLQAVLDTPDMFLHLTSNLFFPEQLWLSLFALLQQSTTDWTLRNNRYGSLTVLEFGKFKTKTQASSMSSKGPTGRTVAFWGLLWESSFLPWSFLCFLTTQLWLEISAVSTFVWSLVHRRSHPIPWL